MNKKLNTNTFSSTCPHDCPSTCSLKIDLGPDGRMVRVRGAEENTYTDGVICAKVARYAERVHHPDRLTKSYRRTGEKGSGDFQEITFDAALDEVAETFLKLAQLHGTETVWPYYYAGTMGLVQRDAINGLRHKMRYSRQHNSICTTPAWAGYVAGTGRLGGVDPREMAKADCIVIWGTNPVATQVNVMTHAIKARKERGTKIVVVDIYETGTMKQADHKIILRPGTDSALAAAIMHVLFRDGLADRDYLERYTDDPKGLEAHLTERTPQWAADITGLSVDAINQLAHLMGSNPKTYIRLGYGMTRQQNGTSTMHAITSIAAVTGSWLHEGGGAFHSNSGTYPINNNLIQGIDAVDPDIRTLDQSRIGAVLCGEAADLYGGPPVHGLFIQNINPMVVAPDLRKVRRGFLRDDLFTCVHEQFMTETALMADIVLPATMFSEHDDIYRSGGHTHLSLGPKIMDPPEGCRSNYEVICGLASRLGLDDPLYKVSAREQADVIVKTSGKTDWGQMQNDPWLDMGLDFNEAHFVDGFNWPDGKYRFKPIWDDVMYPFRSPDSMGLLGDLQSMPVFPDHWDNNETIDETHKFNLATSPARQFLNTSFTETPTSIKREGRPTLLIHPDDAREQAIKDGDEVVIGNEQGEVHLHANHFAGLLCGTLIAEGVWPNKAHIKGEGINTLITDRPIAPFGGVSFHDCRVWLKRVENQA
ncbi:MAG: molybdopterin-dependent oxidoreductase [Hyphomicrobiales bacterium]